MADLNPLAFAVAIRDEATKDLKAIEDKLKSLKDQTITVKVEGLAELKSLLETLKSGGNNAPTTNVGEKMAKEVEQATAALKREEELLEKLKSQYESLTSASSKTSQQQSQDATALVEAEKKLNYLLEEQISIRSRLAKAEERNSQFITEKMAAREKLAKKIIDETVGVLGRSQASKAMVTNDVNDFVQALSKLQGEDRKGFLDNIRRSFVEFIEVSGIATKISEELRLRIAALNQAFGERKNMPTGVKADVDASKQLLSLFQEIAKVQDSFQSKVKKGGLLNNQQFSNIKREEAEIEKEIAAQQQKVNELKTQAAAQSQKETQAAAALAAQEEKVAQATERVAQAQEKAKQAAQQQAQAQAQAQSQLSQKEIGTIAKNAVIEELKRSLGYISEAKEAIKNDSFTKFTERVNKATEAINKLTEAFGKFKTTIGGNQDLKDILSGWGAAIREINTAMAAINAAKNAGGGKKKGVSGQTNEEIKQEEQGLVKVAAAIGRVRDAMASGGGTVNIPFLEGITRTGERNIQTLIKEQAHIERLIALAQKSITFGEGHPVMGMNTLKVGQMGNLQDLEALRNKIREILLLANQGDQAVIRFLNTSGSLKTTPFGKDAMGNDVVLLGGHYDKLTHSVTGTAQAMRNLNREMRLDFSKTNATEESKAARAAQQENDKWAESMRRASIEATKLKIQIEKLKEVESKGKAGGIDTSSLTAQIAQLQSFYQKLLAMSGGAKIHGTAGELVNTAAYQNAIRLANEEAAAIKNAAGATQHFTSEQQRLSQALSQSTEHMKGQSQVLSDLKMLATQYLGVWGGQQFLHNIIEIGGQLEMQRLSIGAILQNAYQANDLFDQIKSLAVQSPFGVVELDQMTKQLSAYGFKYSELFDMTKRLADISAATGTSVDRLALALGHVRSEAALSGYTLRQFSMANVPLLDKLSERLGKTKKEIREMTKKKEIGYEDVLSVIMDLTDEGGMFYNAQEVMSQSVKAKFKNVKDAMDIMYGEMAESSVVGEPLKRLAELLMQVTKSWKDAATVLGTGAAVWLINKARVSALTAALGAQNVATTQAIAKHKAQEVSQLRLASTYRTLSAAEQSQVATSKLLTLNERMRLALHIPLTNAQKLRIQYARKQMMSDLQVALSSGKVTTEYIARQVATGKLTKAEGLLIIGHAKLTVAEEQAGMMAVINTKRMGIYRLALMNVWNAMKGFGSSLLSMGPSMLIMGGITAIMELWSRNKQEMEKAGELGNKIFERWTEGIKKVKEVMEATKMTFTVDGISNIENYGIKPGKIEIPDPSSINSEQMQASIETWDEFIKTYSATPNLMLNAAYATNENGVAVHTLAEQYKILGENATLVMNSLPLLKNVSTALSDAIQESDAGWFDDNLLKDLKQYEDAYKNVGKQVAAVAKNYKMEIAAALTAARENDKFRAALDKAGISAENLSGQTAYLIDRMKEYPEAVKLFNENIKLPGGMDLGGIAFDQKQDLESAFAELQNEFSEVAQKFKQDLSAQGWNFDELKPEQIQAITMAFSDAFTEAGLSVDEVKEKVRDLCKREYGIIIDVNKAEAVAKISAIKHELNELVSDEKRQYSIDIGTTTNFFDVCDLINQAYWKAKKKIEDAPKILIGLGIKVDVADVGFLTDEAIAKIAGGDPIKQAALEEIRNAQRQIRDAVSGAQRLGFQLKNPSGSSGSGKSSNKGSGKNTGSGGTKTYKDEVAEEWKERIRLLKDANALYKEWEQRKNKDEALKRVSEQYGDIFGKWRTDKNLPWKEFKTEDIIDLRDYIQKITDAAQKRYDAQRNDKAKNYGKEAEQVLREGLKALDDIDRHIFDESVKNFSSAIEKIMSELKERWDIYKTVREATSDPLLAQSVAGFGAIDLDARTSAEVMKRELIEQLRTAGGENLLPQIQFDLHLDEEGIRRQLSEAIPDSEKAEEYAEKVESLVKIYKEWQNLQKQVIKDDVSVFSKLIGSVVSYDAKIQKLNDNLQQQEAAIAAGLANGSITDEDADKAIAIAESQYDWEKMKLSAEYANIYNNAVAMSRDEYEHAAAAIDVLLKKLRKLGLISPEDYKSEREKLDKARKEWSESGFLGIKGAMGSFLAGGDEGLLNYYAQRIAKAREQAERTSDPAKKAAYDKEAEHFGNLYNNLAKLSDSTKKIVTAFQTLQSGLNLINGLLEATGKEGGGVKDFTTAISGAVNGATSMSALGSYGMLMGSIIGFATSAATIHNQHIERKLEEINSGIEEIDDTLNMIKDLRKQELGYDYGNARMELARQYEYWKDFPERVGDDHAEKHLEWRMYQYYSQGSDEVNGYATELALLKKQRDELKEAWEIEVDKKHPSDDALEEYVQKMAEVEIQIKNFTQELAKELWDIDVKGWADQLSDALASAFENGESMAKAYGDTVRSILQSVMQKMMQIKILEPMFESLQDKLFGEKGVFNVDDINGSMSAVTKVIGEFFGKGGEGERSITAATEFMTAFQHGLQSVGLSVLNDSSSTLSSDVSGIKEETADLLAAYVNALRQDVAVNRLLQTQFVTEMWPSYIEQFTQAVSSLNNIDSNVATIRALLSENGALYVMLDSMKSHFDNITNGNERVMVQ